MDVNIIKRALQLNNGSLRDTAQYLKIPYQNLAYHVRKNNIPYKSKRNNINILKLKELYKKHQSLSLVAQEIGATKEGVRKAMRRANININKLIQYSFDKNFFKKDNESSFYWAGFIAADGCITLQSKSDILKISLSKKDKSHLEKFKTHIKSNHPIHEYIIKNSKRNSKWNDNYSATVNICSNDYFKDLQKFNITYRKTHTYTFPDYVLNNKLCRHFMRGYVDGDGSWYYQDKDKFKNQLSFNLRGTKSLLTTFQRILIENCNLSQTKIRENNGISSLDYGGNLQCKRIHNYLYSRSRIYLDRKKAIKFI